MCCFRNRRIPAFFNESGSSAVRATTSPPLSTAPNAPVFAVPRPLLLGLPTPRRVLFRWFAAYISFVCLDDMPRNKDFCLPLMAKRIRTAMYADFCSRAKS
ncbi:MAG: hypothetical protein M2R46_03452 [Verrucomicrobia subdivision 3 bacterium]|nr:hypothetical protein [Limisphaerales bacterium]